MNILNTQQYLQDRLPNFNVTFEEMYKGEPNTRFIFEKDGVDAAVLLANKLDVQNDLLNSIADAVQSKFSTAAPEKFAEKKAKEETETQPKITEIDGSPSELEFSFYKAARKVVTDFEAKYPMT